MKTVAILQSDYIPWKGYFDLINLADEFILFDDVQYTKRDWRNRNKIKTRNGAIWITIPVEVKGKYFQKIKETLITDPTWNKKHWESIVSNYAKCEYFREYKDMFRDLYLGSNERYLSLINYRFISAICRLLSIKTKISWSNDYRIVEGKTERLVSLCKQSGAAEYISGPSAKGYIDEQQFSEAGIVLTYMGYSAYPEYDQMFPPFDHAVSIIDLIFNTGPDAIKYMKSF
jgi:hypothetical protein